MTLLKVRLFVLFLWHLYFILLFFNMLSMQGVKIQADRRYGCQWTNVGRQKY